MLLRKPLNYLIVETVTIYEKERPLENLVGKRLGCYYLTRYLARGGMSEIYLASDKKDEQMYALKLVWQINEEDSLRLNREARILTRLTHPNVLPILDYGEQDGICYSVMPYIAHGTVKDRIALGRLSAEEAGAILIQVADALQFLHEAGFVHRDVKPANILLDGTNHVWLADFGLATEINREDDLTATGCLFGTPSYMAPELADTTASTSSDVYALGVVLYEMLTGHVPFDGKTPEAIYRKQIYVQPPLPSLWNPSLSPALEQVLLRALEKRPRNRYTSAQALAEAYGEARLSKTPIPYLANANKNIAIKLVKARRVKSWRGYTRRSGLALVALIAMALLTLGMVNMRGTYSSDAPFLAINSAQAIAGQAAETHLTPTSTSSVRNAEGASFKLKKASENGPGKSRPPNPHKPRKSHDDN